MLRAQDFLVVFAVAIAFLGCPTMRTSAPRPAPDLVWPTAPARPRVRYLSSLRGPHGFERGTSLVNRLKNFVLGKAVQRFIRPTAVAVRGDTLAVADPGTPAVFVLNRAAGSAVTITAAGSDRLVSPVGVTLGAGGDVFVADSYLGRIFRFDEKGKLRQAWGGSELRRPTSLAMDESRHRLYVVDARDHRVRVYGPQGRLLLSFGGRGVGFGQFNFPGHVCLDGQGRVYVVDALNFRVQMFDPGGRFLAAFGHQGDGSGDFSRPKGVAVDSGGDVYVVDALFDAVQMFDRQGRFLMTFGEHGTGLGQFWLPTGIAVDVRDRVYVADSYNRRVQVFQFLGPPSRLKEGSQ